MTPCPPVFEKEGEDGELIELDAPIAFVNVRVCLQGVWQSIPRQYTVEELSSAEQLHAQLGPGSYELIGRDERNARVVRRVRVVIAPLPGEVGQFGKAQPTPVEPRQPAAVAADPGERLLMFMLQQSQAQAQAQATMMQGVLGLITAVMQSSSQNSDKVVQQMTAMFTGFGQQQSEIMRAAIERANASSPQEVFLQAVKTVSDLREGAREATEESGDGLAETIDAVAKGVEVFKSLQGGDSAA